MIGAPAPTKLETAEDWLVLGEYWSGYATDSGKGWGSACHAFQIAATKFEAAGDTERAEYARVWLRSASAAFERAVVPPPVVLPTLAAVMGYAGRYSPGEYHSPLCNGVDCAPTCRPIR